MLPHRGVASAADFRTSYEFSYYNKNDFDIFTFLQENSTAYCQASAFAYDAYANAASGVFRPPSLFFENSDPKFEINTRVFQDFQRISQYEHTVLNKKDERFYSDQMEQARRSEWESFKSFEVFGDFMPQNSMPHNSKLLYPVVVSSIKDVDTAAEKYKCRLAIDGSRLQSKMSCPVCPLTHETRRLLMYLGIRRGLEIGTADAKNGYLQAHLGETDFPIFMRVPDWAPGWVPGCVAQVRRAVYGLPDSGRIFQLFVSRILLKIGFTELVHFPGVFQRGAELIGVYVDDLFICAHNVDSISAEISAAGLLLGSVDKFKTNGPKIKYNGLEISLTNRFVQEDMSIYISKLLDSYKDMTDHKILKQYSTPGFLGNDELFTEKSDLLCLKKYDPHSIVASCLYLTRLARPDISHSVSFLTRQVNCWSKGADVALARLMGYLSNAPLSIFQELPEPTSEFFGCETIEYFSDADLGGDVTTSRSCGGDCSYLCFPRSDGTTAKWLIGWSSKLLTQKSGATATTELAAHQRGLEARAMPISLFLEDIQKFECPIYGNLDNAASVSAIRHGYSAALRHLARHSRLSLVHLNAFYLYGANKLAYVKTGDNTSDIFTKALPENLHWQFVGALLMWRTRI